MTGKITTSDDVEYAGRTAIARFRGVSARLFYHNKLKSGDRSFKWGMWGVRDEKKAAKIVAAVERKLVSMGLDVTKAFVATCESRYPEVHGTGFGVRIWIAGI